MYAKKGEELRKQKREVIIKEANKGGGNRTTTECEQKGEHSESGKFTVAECDTNLFT